MNEQRILEHIPLANAIAGRMTRFFPACYEHDDFRSAAYLGLIYADRNFDEKRGVSFKTYARHCIRGMIIEEVRSGDSASRSHRRQINTGEMEQIEFLSISHITKDSAMAHLQPRASDRQSNPEILLHWNEREDRLYDALDTLPERQREALQLYVIEERNWREVVEEMGISEGRLSQLLKEALEKLRAELKSDNVEGISLRSGMRRRSAV